ncbi:MAG: glycosyltransferase family 4 protein [Endomicrobiia bacterium]
MEKKIKVAHIITKLELGGAQRNTLYTVQNLDRKNFLPVLISGKGGILDNEAKNLKDTKLYFLKSLIREINPLSDILALIALTKILRKEKPDIVHTHSSKAGILGRWASKFSGVPIIIHTFHGFGFNDYQKWFTKNFFILLEKLTAKITNKLIAVSKENIKTALKYKIGTKDKYILIRSGIKLSFYKNLKIDINQKKSELGLPKNSKIITTIGPFKPQKNLTDFIEMAKIVVNYSLTYSPFFLIIGDGEQRKELGLKIKDLNLTEKILLPGWRKDIPELLAITDIFVMTSLWEGLPRAVVEAMVSCKPVVAYSVDGIKDIIVDGKNGFLAKPKDVRTLSEKVIMLLRDEDLAKKLGETGRNSIDESFDIDFMVTQQEKLYQELLLNQGE